LLAALARIGALQVEDDVLSESKTAERPEGELGSEVEQNYEFESAVTRDTSMHSAIPGESKCPA